ncbi:MAG: ArsR/SmtB family transcription factor [Kofleriaceae bacterium]
MPRRRSPVPTRDPDIAALARVLADPSRAAMLDALLDGDGHAIGQLARRAGISAATASSHLRALTGARLVVVEAAGREHRVRLASPEVAEVLERLAALTAPAAAWTAGARTRRDELRFARTCYDHLAGVLAILAVSALVDRGWLHRTTDSLEPAPALFDWLAAHGQPVEISGVAGGRRPLSRACLDWTERVPHVAGRIGTALASVFVEQRWVARVRDTRALRVTERGRTALGRELGISLPMRRRG